MRTILHAFDTDQLTALTESTSVAAVEAALGYLGCWNSAGYSHCTLWINAEHQEINALYRSPRDGGPVYRSSRDDGPVGYCIGAVWHDDHFGFHS